MVIQFIFHKVVKCTKGLIRHVRRNTLDGDVHDAGIAVARAGHDRLPQSLQVHHGSRGEVARAHKDAPKDSAYVRARAHAGAHLKKIISPCSYYQIN